MIKQIEIEEFLHLRNSVPIIDVRSDKEYKHAHIPNALSIPLFSDAERKEVGICYKQKGRQKAILLGLDFVGPNMSDFSKQALKYANSNKLILYCWRGGMRSASMAWLFSTVGIDVYVLKGGYKTYRQYAHQIFEQKANYVVLGGMTGSGKTKILEELQTKGEQVVDLEGLANHKGSAFGTLGQNPQTSTEQFENNLFEILNTLDFAKPIWIEDESRSIGRICIPDELYQQMRNSLVMDIEIPSAERIKFLTQEYGFFSPQILIKSVEKIQKRLGGNDAKHAIEAINDNNIPKAIKIVLDYYDKAYQYGLSKRTNNKVHTINLNSINHQKNAAKIVEVYSLIIKNKYRKEI